jgi:hypothetical protein
MQITVSLSFTEGPNTEQDIRADKSGQHTHKVALMLPLIVSLIAKTYDAYLLKDHRLLHLPFISART